ncbi:MAG: hypothetical protein K1X82_08670 [Bacteroidia bacterium]|nr:hypothetical protein [Bacteroidia bacterium]
MYFAQNSSIDKFELYNSFLERIIDSNNAKYVEIFSKILQEAKLLANKNIDYTGVSIDIFDIVTLFALNHTEYFVHLDVSNLKEDDYKEISRFLKDDIAQLV